MEDQLLSLKQVREVDISKCSIISNDRKNTIDIPDGISDLYYYESVLQETIRVSIVYTDTGNSVKTENGTKTIVDGLPLVGTESVSLKMKDANGVELNQNLYVNKINPLMQDTTKSLVSFDLVSKEGILNYKVVLNTRFDGRISDHIKKILTDQNYLSTKKKLYIEETENSYNFIGNNRRPFYVCTWLAKKSIPKISSGNSVGKTAGYFFFETATGFHFKSVDNLLSDKEPGTGNRKKYKKFIFTQTPDGNGKNIPEGYSGKILEHNVDTVSGDIQSKLEIGTYTTRTILFDPFNCYYEVINPNAEEIQKQNAITLAGKKLPKLNPEFNREGKNKDFTRTQYMLIDKGTLPTGNTNQQIEKSKKENFDPKNILNQSSMRYNQLFNVRTTITVVADFSLHAGDLIYIDYPELSNNENKDTNKQFGGFYLIADLCHYINRLKGGYTKLTLVRDSIGKKNSTYNVL